jgi:hypothetical protein
MYDVWGRHCQLRVCATVDAIICKAKLTTPLPFRSSFIGAPIHKHTLTDDHFSFVDIALLFSFFICLPP